MSVNQAGLRIYFLLIHKEIRWFYGSLQVVWPRPWVSPLVCKWPAAPRSRNMKDAQTRPGAQGSSCFRVYYAALGTAHGGYFVRIYCINY